MAKNMLFIFTDQHQRDVTGCYGNQHVHTPNMDSIASGGVCFSNAYTNCPICIPARASLATGEYVHRIGYWDNGIPYDGEVRSWTHRLREAGHTVDAIGKLHYRSSDDDNGFTQEINTMHVVDKIGDVLGCIRDNPPLRNKRPGINDAGPGSSTYIDYDRDIGDRACQWIQDHSNESKPWMLFVGFVQPHPPYITPKRYFDLYSDNTVPMPPQWRQEEWPDHPAMEYFRKFFNIETPFEEDHIRRVRETYYGTVSQVDFQIGRVLDALDRNGLLDSTTIVYSSDHGDAVGARGMFGKFTMYEESAAVPLMISGPDIPAGKTVSTPMSLVDLYPTILENFDIPLTEEEKQLPGESLFAHLDDNGVDRVAFSEYHAVGSINGAFMLRDRRYKYIYHAHWRPQLFDLINDPEEKQDLYFSEEHKDLLPTYEKRLREIVDPEEADRRAKQDQEAMVEKCGGREYVINRGAFTNTPAPGEVPKFNSTVR